MNALAIFRIAARALFRNKGRSLLTALGIIIGIAAVIAVVAVGQGAAVTMQTQISSMGNNLAMVFPGSMHMGGFRGGAGTRHTLTADDGEAILRESPYAVAVTPVVRSGAQVIYRENDWATSIQGVGVSYPEVRSWSMKEGDFFTESEVRSGSRVGVLGATVAEQLFAGEDPVGKSIRIRNMSFRVLGVLARKGSAAWGQDQDDMIVIPWTTARRVLENSPFSHVNQLLISLTSMDDLPQAREDISNILRQRHRLAAGADDDFTVTDMTEVTQMITQVSSLMSMLLTVIASISLIVGGIGIMNIMLVSVTERTREIGLRMAVGARRRDILMQFVVEAITLAGAGGILGIILGIVVAKGVAGANNWPVVVSPGAVLLALSFSAGIGIFFGFYPAWRASRLNPIESLRHE
ncbi:MAG TPA: multidrug ABC transporter substrate-binding protein [Verrucomicrobia bacterium]|nr:MAG: multidrug ABC transporter substrate-binding protein [Lentisphaerae bacterium GWF2_57_35]HBA83659.1 multidrug ABC transporter substrate-binding protein [Verrucomicrobiota bacterium]